jgi:hypothetical protein
MEAVESPFGAGESVGYFDSAQFEAGASPTAYQFIPSLALDGQPLIEKMDESNGAIVLEWQGGNEGNQLIQRTTDVTAEPWQTVATNPPTPALTRTGVDTNPPPENATYRISTE